jgi:hypothetical protein
VSRAPRAALAAVAAALACGERLPDPLPRVVDARPTGVVARDGLRAEFTVTEPLSPVGVVDGRRAALCLAGDLATVKRLAAEPAGLGPGAPVLAARIALEDGGRKVVLVPAAPLVPGTRFAALLAAGVRAADGRAVVDAAGHARAVAVEFETEPAAPPSPDPSATPAAAPLRLVLTEVLADAAAPEEGGEYAEVVNLGDEAVDLTGFRLAKTSASGAVARCAVARSSGGPLERGGAAIVTGGAYDGRYVLPPDVAVYRCGGSALAGGLANDRAPALRLEDPAGGIASAIGVTATAPRCAAGAALHRLDPAGPDAPANLACGPPSPGQFP